MAKKRFTDDLFDLFEPDPQPEADQAASVADEAGEALHVDVQVGDQARKKLSGKNFTQDLDAYLSDSFNREPGTTPRQTPTRRKRRRTGLDLLIQSTINDDPDRTSRGGNTDETKRVTLIFNKAHLAELKEMAKTRNIYLKDLVQEMVANYLQEED